MNHLFSHRRLWLRNFVLLWPGFITQSLRKHCVRPALATVLLIGACAQWASANTTEELPAGVRAALERFELNGTGLSIYVQRVGATKPVLQYQADTARNPASVMKLLTSYAALQELGANYTWKTRFYSSEPLKDGQLNGELWLRGGGDPFLPLERMWLLVHQLRNTGLQKINGDLLIDQSFFQINAQSSNDFDGQSLRAYNVVPAALVANFNATRFLFRPADAGKVDIQPVPDLPGLTIDNRLRLSARSCGGYQRGVAINLKSPAKVVFEGKFPDRCEEYSMLRSVMDKNQYAAELFGQLWRQSGGEWGGSFREQSRDYADDEQPMLEFESLPLAELIRAANKYSNNLMSRILLLTLGAEKLGAPGSVEKGRQAVAKYLQRAQIAAPELRLVNGAGLSRDVRISARGMHNVLQAAWASPYMPEMLASMAISGEDGTFARRHQNSEIAGKTHLKSGRLNNVIALAGFVQSRSGQRYIVVVLHNDKDVHRGSGHAVEDALLRWVYQQSKSEAR